jgi:ferritin-like metal-binding protein YciE
MAGKKLTTLQDLLVMELKDLYSAENQIIKALPKMIKAATSEKLRTALEEHLEETKEQAARLEKVCEEIGASPSGHKCAAMEGLIEEGKEILEQKGKAADAVLDAAIITAAQRVEHYEMAGYGCAATFAKLLGFDKAAKMLGETLEEEKNADSKLTEIAESEINADAITAEA